MQIRSFNQSFKSALMIPIKDLDEFQLDQINKVGSAAGNIKDGDFFIGKKIIGIKLPNDDRKLERVALDTAERAGIEKYTYIKDHNITPERFTYMCSYYSTIYM